MTNRTPRLRQVIISLDAELETAVTAFRWEKHHTSQAAAIRELIALGLKAAKGKPAK